MKKYNIEGGIDFFAELYKSLHVDENEDDDKNKCLITDQLLTDKYVTLNCGHKFNYIPLYNYLVNYKNKFNVSESKKSILNKNEIRCPYCRKKQLGTLIYYEELGLEKVHGVNFYDPYLKQDNNNLIHNCEYLYPNPNYNPNEEISDTNKKYLTELKCHLVGKQISVYNPLKQKKPLNYGDMKYYCYKHKNIMIKQYNAEEKAKIKEAKKKEKEEKQKEKQKAKEEKQKDKQIKNLKKQNANAMEKDTEKVLENNLMSENVVLGPSIIQTGCVQILKTGPNKGNLCGCKIFSENMCKRHITKN